MAIQQIPKSHKEALAPTVADRESVQAVYTWPMEDSPKSKTVAVTDRRFFRISKGETQDSGREFEIIETIPLEKISRAKMEVWGEEPPDLEEAILGAIMAVLAVPVFLWGIDQPEPMNQVGAIGALILFIVGILIVANAYDTEDGSVTLRLRTTDGENRSVRFPQDQKNFAETVVNAVGG